MYVVTQPLPATGRNRHNPAMSSCATRPSLGTTRVVVAILVLGRWPALACRSPGERPPWQRSHLPTAGGVRLRRAERGEKHDGVRLTLLGGHPDRQAAAWQERMPVMGARRKSYTPRYRQEAARLV